MFIPREKYQAKVKEAAEQIVQLNGKQQRSDHLWWSVVSEKIFMIPRCVNRNDPDLPKVLVEVAAWIELWVCSKGSFLAEVSSMQLAQCPKCLRKVYPGTRNSKRHAYDYIVNVKGEIESANSHTETCPWGPQRNPFTGGMRITGYADFLDDIQMLWKLDCAVLEPRPPIDWNDVALYREQPPLRHLTPIICQLVKAGGPYPQGHRDKLAESIIGTVVSRKRTVVALIVASELFDTVHEFLYQYDSRSRGKKPLQQVIVAGYWLLLDSTVPSDQNQKYHYGF